MQEFSGVTKTPLNSAGAWQKYQLRLLTTLYSNCPITVQLLQKCNQLQLQMNSTKVQNPPRYRGAHSA